MLTPSLALLTRALRLDARLLRAHLVRMLFLGFVFFSLLIAHVSSGWYGAPGLQFFRQIALLNAVLLTLAGIGFFSTAITEEKDEGMLGLLRMAGMGPLVLLLGKSTSRMLSALLILGVQVPFALLAVTLGGVTAQQVLAVYVALAAYLVLLANLGLFCSVAGSGSATASGLMALALGLFLICAPLIDAELAVSSAPPGFSGTLWTAAAWVSSRLVAASVFVRLNTILDISFDGSVWSFQVWSNFAAAGAFFGLSWLLFDRLTDARRPLFAWLRRRPNAPDRLPTRSPRRVWKHPVVWKDFHFLAGGRRMMIAKVILYGLGIDAFWGFWLWTSVGGFTWPGSPSELGEIAMIGMILAAVVELSLLASNLFRGEVKDRTLPLLMMIPRDTGGIAYAKAGGALLSLTPAVGWFCVGAVLAPDSFFDGLEPFFTYPEAIIAWLYLLIFVLFLYLTAYLSLMVKWGALPLAIGLLSIGFGCCISPFSVIFVLIGEGFGSEVAAVFPYFALSVGLLGYLHYLIGRRLEALSSR